MPGAESAGGIISMSCAVSVGALQGNSSCGCQKWCINCGKWGCNEKKVWGPYA